MASNAEIDRRRDESIARAIAYSSTFVAARAQGGEVWDVEGKRYIDFCGGIGCQNVGHGHPKVVAAIEEQARAFTHTCFQISPYESYVALAERLNALAPGGLGGTFGGNPVACAAALAVLEVIAEEGLLEKGIVLGTHIDRRFRAMAERNSGSCIGDVRALGCMNAIEIVSDRETREPAGDLTSEIVKIALSKGLILVTAGPTRNVIRVLVPLSTSTEIVDEGLDILEAAIGEAASRTSRSAA